MKGVFVFVRAIIIFVVTATIGLMLVNRGIHSPLWLRENTGQSGIFKVAGDYIHRQFAKYIDLDPPQEETDTQNNNIEYNKENEESDQLPEEEAVEEIPVVPPIEEDSIVVSPQGNLAFTPAPIQN